jgi:SAM-dependent methyltransferase
MSREELLAQARAQDVWYHTIELGPDYTTPGWIDLRSVARRVLPDRLDGLRALDVGTFDGFWAFELESRGAREVLATDLPSYDNRQWPPATRARLGDHYADTTPADRFRIASALRDSKVRHLDAEIHGVSHELLGGPVDYAVIGALLLHVRDPVGGLEAVRSVLSPGGRVLLVEPFDVPLTVLRPRTPSARLRAGTTLFDWWVGNLACLHDYLAVAGFEAIRRRGVFRPRAVRHMRQWYAAVEGRRGS